MWFRIWVLSTVPIPITFGHVEEGVAFVVLACWEVQAMAVLSELSRIPSRDDFLCLMVGCLFCLCVTFLAVLVGACLYRLTRVPG